MTAQIVFFGSSRFSLLVLQKLLDNHLSVAAVITSPDKPIGRHLRLTPNPVKLLAQKHHLPVFVSHREFKENFILNNNHLVGLVAAYGQIIPSDITNIFNTHIYNIHPSLLPKYRGPSPLQQQLLDGVAETGVTVFRLDEKMDHGPLIHQQKENIRPEDTADSLGNRLFIKGADIFIKNFPKITNLKTTVQDETRATYTKKLTRKDGFIPWEDFSSQLKTGNRQLTAKFRAYSPWPGVWTKDPRGKRIKLVSLSPLLVQPEGSNKPIPWPISPVPGP